MTARLRRYGGTAAVLDAWVLALAVFLCWPLATRAGYGVAHDLVFTPRQPLTWASWGLGTSSPRAVPVDGLVSLSAFVLDGAWVERIAVVGLLVVAGAGAHRLARPLDLPARLLVAGFAVWNPFVSERLALGQWALLWTYAAAWWLVPAAARYRREPGVRPVASWGAVTGWLALASITPTGGLLGSGIALVVGSGGGRRRTLGLVSTVVLLQLTWLMPALLGSAALTSDPRGVAAFAARAERPGGAWLSLLGLGGVWDSGSTPVSRGGALGYLTTLVVLAAVLVGMRRLRDLFDAGTTRRLAVLALLGLLLSAASSIPVLEPVMRWVVDTIPGAGLLRDAQKWLLPFVLLATLCLGACADACLGVLRRRSRPWVLPGVVVTLALPMLLLPDAAATVWPTLDPVTYPSDFSRVAGILSRPHAAAGELVTLPWRSYRRFDWNRQVSTFDPAAQWFDREVVTSDELVVGTTHLRGEDPDASRVGAAVTSGRPMSSALPRLGVRWVLVYRDDPAVSALDLSGLHRRYAGSALSLYRARGPLSASAAADQPAAWDRVVVIVLDGLALLIVLAAAVASVTVGFQTRRHV